MSMHENGWKLTVMRKRQRSLERETRNHRVRGNLLHQGLEAVGLIINHNHRRKGKSKIDEFEDAFLQRGARQASNG
jgi:hypothetical protein